MDVVVEDQPRTRSKLRNLLWVGILCLALGISVGVSAVGRPPFDLLPTMLRGVVVTAKLTVGATLLSIVVAMIAGVARASKNRLMRALSGFYVEIFRGTSALVQMFWIFFVLPLPPFHITLTSLQAGILALGLNVGAYGAEVVRGAILAIPKSQIEATIALNMPPFLTLRRVILPQAMVRILPPFGNLVIELLKATALVSLITLPDVTFQTLSLRMTVGRTTELFTLLLIIYFLLAYPLTLGVRWLERQRRWA
ncbi:MAG TPA: ectoine/hydroxyectoine ABC transporter permease subunit EhuC [Anaerolineae bacterium]|nr:ectoine/hydroxyectoine ABC transporter permease subunit EhuC [Anaerolineae bacterium]